MKKNSSSGTATQPKSAEAADEQPQKAGAPKAPANVDLAVPGAAVSANGSAPPVAKAAAPVEPRPDAVTFIPVPVPPKNAAADQHAESSLAQQQVAYAEHQRLKAAVQEAQTKANGKRGDVAIHDLAIELEDEIEGICTGPSGWLDPEATMAEIHGLRARVAEKRHTISRLTGAADLEAARENLRQFEDGHPLFTTRATPAPMEGDGPVMAAKREAAKAKVDALKPSLEPALKAAALCACGHAIGKHSTSDKDGPHDGPCIMAHCACDEFVEDPAKPVSEGAQKLATLLGGAAAPVYAGPPTLAQGVRGDLAAAGFRWSGKPIRTAVAEEVEAAFAAWKGAKGRGQKKGQEAAAELLRAFGWCLVPEGGVVLAPVLLTESEVPY